MITILWAMCCWLNQIRSTKPAIHSARAHFIHWLVEIVLPLIRVYQWLHCLTHHEHLRWTSCLSLPAWLAVNLFWVIVKNHKSWTITGIISAAYLHARGASIPTYITRTAVFHLYLVCSVFSSTLTQSQCSSFSTSHWEEAQHWKPYFIRYLLICCSFSSIPSSSPPRAKNACA